MSPGEAWRLFNELLGDPSSHTFAAAAGWEYPLSREGLILSDVYDLGWQSVKRRGRFKPYPRPMPPPGRKRIGRTDLPAADARRLLDAVGPLRMHVTADGRTVKGTRKQIAYWTRKAVST